MEKRIIDADALLAEFKSALDFNDPTNTELNIGWKGACLMIIEKINELATLAPKYEPQENIFDAHVFNLKEESRHSQYWRPNDILISNQDTIIKLSADNFNCHKLRKLRNITAEQRCLYSKICELADRLDEKIQQESIFDADGWCDDFNLAPDNTDILFHVDTKVALGKKIKNYDGGIRYLLYSLNGLSDVTMYMTDKTGLTFKFKKWRPLLTPPKEA